MPNPPKDYSASAVDKMLKQHNCPVPFHVVRTRFLGNIATPSPSVKPIEMVKRLWGGELPAVDSIETLNKILEMLIMGLWNDLARHQKRTAPFRLLRFDHSESREALARIAEIRAEELDGFADGLLGPDDDLDLPSRAAEAMDHLGELRALFAGVHQLATRDSIEVDKRELKKTFGSVRELTLIAEKEIHAAVLACMKARQSPSSRQ